MTAFKRVIASVLIALQLAQPAAAATPSFNFVAALKSQALKVVSDSLASGLGFTGADPLAERAMDAAMQAQAIEAVNLFGLADPANGKSSGAELFDPGKPEQSSKQRGRWKALVAATQGKKTLSIDEMQEASSALLPFLRYIDQGSAKKPDYFANQVIVPTGATLRLNMFEYGHLS